VTCARLKFPASLLGEHIAIPRAPNALNRCDFMPVTRYSITDPTSPSRDVKVPRTRFSSCSPCSTRYQFRARRRSAPSRTRVFPNPEWITSSPPGSGPDLQEGEQHTQRAKTSPHILPNTNLPQFLFSVLSNNSIPPQASAASRSSSK
jgi:hypothetical protein